MKNKKVAVVISGGNIDVNFTSRIIEKGLVKTGRNAELRTIIDDRPGALQQLLSIIAANKANVISINHHRLDPDIPLNKAQVDVLLETQSREHVEMIMKDLNSRGYNVQVII